MGGVKIPRGASYHQQADVVSAVLLLAMGAYTLPLLAKSVSIFCCCCILHTGLASYCSSKAGLTHLTKVLALEWARHGIRVNAVCPGYFKTEMNSDFFDTPKVRPACLARVPPDGHDQH